MSHCCGGCGGEDPLMKDKEAEAPVKDAKNSAEKSDAVSKPLKAETWQPEKK
jgi:hypothetical protein